ncbi:MAG: threonine/serine exporter family protein [Bacteroidales bacterium]|nr:threonine/serine exporter family protein [Bacteroidales bacterium]
MTDKTMANTESFDDKCRFIIELGKAAHSYVSPAIRLESYLNRVTAAFGLEGEFHSTPTNMIFAFREKEDDWQKINLSVVQGGLDLTKLPALDDIVDEIVVGKLSIKEAESRLTEVAKSADPYGNAMQAFGYYRITG